MYQPLDHIISQGETGSEMYFLIEGTALLIHVVEQITTLCAILMQGDYFGEESILNVSTRGRSIVAASYCSIYILTKQSFESVLIFFPDIEKDMQVISEKEILKANISPKKKTDKLQI